MSNARERGSGSSVALAFLALVSSCAACGKAHKAQDTVTRVGWTASSENSELRGKLEELEKRLEKLEQR
jgi:ABC-type phosphate/phosphonate transport system substrate-binding protein